MQNNRELLPSPSSAQQKAVEGRYSILRTYPLERKDNRSNSWTTHTYS